MQTLKDSNQLYYKTQTLWNATNTQHQQKVIFLIYFLFFLVCLHARPYLIHTYWFSIDFDHVHDLDGIVSILLPHELNESIALVTLCYAILGHVNVD